MLKKITLLLAFIFLQGCTDTNLIHSPSYIKGKEKIKSLEEQVIKDSLEVQMKKDNFYPEIIQSGVVDDFYVNTELFSKKKEVVLPEAFESVTGISVTGTLKQLTKDLERLIVSSTGMSIEIQEFEEEKPQAAEKTDEMPSELGDTILDPLLPQPQESPSSYSGNQEDELDVFEFTFEGTLKELISRVAILNKMRWEYIKQTNSIVLSNTQTLIYTLPILAHSSTATVSVSSGSSSTATSNEGSSSTSLSFSTKSDPWEGIISGLAELVSNKGNFSVNKEAGIIEVTDLYTNKTKIDSYIYKIKNLYSAQLLVDVRVIHLSDTEENNKEISWSSINNKIGKAVMNSSFGSGALNPASTLFLGYKKDPEANQNNISTAINLLSSYAESYSVDSFSAITTNFKPVPIQLAGEVVYFKKTETQSEASDDSGATSSAKITYEPIQKTLGTTITLTPSIIKGDINLSYVFQKTHLDSVQQDPAGSPFPLTGTKTFVQSVRLQNSIPMVISAVNTENSTNNSSSPLATGMWFMGGKESNKLEKTKDIILVTVTKMKENFTDHRSTYYDDKIVEVNEFLKSR
jgi:hypothetical protein